MIKEKDLIVGCHYKMTWGEIGEYKYKSITNRYVFSIPGTNNTQDSWSTSLNSIVEKVENSTSKSKRDCRCSC